ncbi:MAG: response regulator transcription factor, partial [Candidatus Dormibacteraeota bacterium]|nr:response regulator transcription factor [Candidatus Dormibacteraeota bacterium]
AETRVLIVTTFAMDEYVFEAVRAGASGFVVKDIEPEDLLGAIRVVAAGDALLSPPVTRTLIAEFARQARRGAAAVPGMADLTEREREVLKLVAGGRTNAEIGSELFMSPATAKTHVSRILSKLDARDRAQLVVIAYESGVVSPGG